MTAKRKSFLPETEREKFLKKHETNLFEAYGVVMKRYLAMSYAHAKTLKPKPSKKKR